MLDDGKKAIVRSELPKKLAESNLFSTGVKINARSVLSVVDATAPFAPKENTISLALCKLFKLIGCLNAELFAPSSSK